MNNQIPFLSPFRSAWSRLISVARAFALSLAVVIPTSPGSAEAGQVFLVDFDTFSGATTNDHNYTPGERAQIVGEMDALFAPLGMSVTDIPPIAEPFSTVFFNAPAASTSDGVDLGNLKKSDNAQVNAKKMLEVVGVAEVDMTSEKIVRASINVGMHEALHLVGARHQDAFTAVGTGLPTSGLATQYDPDYPGPVMATLTDRTFMSLTTLLGVTEEKLVANDLFISPRSAMKAILGDHATPTQRVPGNNHPDDAQPVIVHLFDVPNTVPPGVVFPYLPDEDASELELSASVAWIAGSLLLSEAAHPTHYFLLPAVAGQRYTIEAYSDVLDHRESFSPVDVFVAALNPVVGGYPTLPYYGTGGFNYDGYESTDAAIIDIIVPPPLEAMIADIGPQGGGGAGDYELIVYSIKATPPVEPPVLSIEPMNDDVIISWTPPSTNWVLQENLDLASTNWVNSPSGSTNPIVVPATLPTKFYRLFKP